MGQLLCNNSAGNHLIPLDKISIAIFLHRKDSEVLNYSCMFNVKSLIHMIYRVID